MYRWLCLKVSIFPCQPSWGVLVNEDAGDIKSAVLTVRIQERFDLSSKDPC